MPIEFLLFMKSLAFISLLSLQGAGNSEAETAEPKMVPPKVPATFLMIRDGRTSHGVFETEGDEIKVLQLQEGDVAWEIRLTWSGGALTHVRKRGENPKLGRSVVTEIEFDRNEDGLIKTQRVRSRGKERYEVRYDYGSSLRPQGATVTSKDNQAIERLRYEYGDKSWSRPLYLYTGLHFGQVRTYSDYATQDGEMTLFSVAEYNEEDWRIESLATSVSNPDYKEKQAFEYDFAE